MWQILSPFVSNEIECILKSQRIEKMLREKSFQVKLHFRFSWPCLLVKAILKLVTIYLSNLMFFCCITYTKPISAALICFYIHYVWMEKNKNMAWIINYVHLEVSSHGRVFWCHPCEVKLLNLDFTVWKGNSLSCTALTACHIPSCIFCWQLVNHSLLIFRPMI